MQNPIGFLVNYKIGLKLIFSVCLKLIRRTELCVHQNTASCVLSCSKCSLLLKTTCPCRELKTPSEVGVLYEIKMDLL